MNNNDKLKISILIKEPFPGNEFGEGPNPESVLESEGISEAKSSIEPVKKSDDDIYELKEESEIIDHSPLEESYTSLNPSHEIVAVYCLIESFSFIKSLISSLFSLSIFDKGIHFLFFSFFPWMLISK